MRSNLLFALSFAVSFAHAALPSDAGRALSFYRNKNSAFPSGQVSRAILEQRLVRVENEIAFQARWDHRQFSLQSQSLLRDLQVARFVDTKSTVPLYQAASAASAVVKQLPASSTVEILTTDDYWAQVRDTKSKALGWTALHQLKNRHDDVGVYRNIVSTPLRPAANLKGLPLLSIPPLSRVIPLEIQKEFIKVEYQGKTGYADITHFVSRADFAHLAYHPEKGWVTVQHRNNHVLLTAKNESLRLSEIKGYVTNGARGIVVKDGPPGSPPLRARVEILKPEAHIWAVSRVDGHGEVWWKQQSLLTEEVVKNSQDTLTTDQLLKREIFSIAFENKNSVKGLVSSEGVYRTEDGLTWTRVPLFGKQNIPVSIHPNGTWFAGSYKSADRGKTFLPFIRWDKLAQAIEASYHRNPKILRLTSIESLPNSQVQISVDTGSHKVKLKSLIGDVRWDVIRN